jgi:hypothetical protein
MTHISVSNVLSFVIVFDFCEDVESELLVMYLLYQACIEMVDNLYYE